MTCCWMTMMDGRYLGYGNTAQVEFSELRPYVRPDTSEWRPGTECSAIASDADGVCYYHALGEWKEFNAVGKQVDFRDHISYK